MSLVFGLCPRALPSCIFRLFLFLLCLGKCAGLFLEDIKTCTRDFFFFFVTDPEKNDVSSLGFEYRLFYLLAGVLLRKSLDSLSSVDSSIHIIRAN